MKGKTRLIYGALIAFIIMAMCGCGGSSDSGSSDSGGENSSGGTKEYISDDEVTQIFSAPNDYKGKYAKITGKVFSIIEYDGDDVYFQVFNDPVESSRAFVVTAKTDSAQIKEDDYAIIDGRIDGEIEGENLFGGDVKAPHIIADSVEVSTYIDVVSPTIRKLSGSLHKEQHGYTITVTDVEFASNETRVYMTIKNEGSDTFNCYPMNMKLIQSGKQYEQQDNYEAGYQEIQTELLPGAETSGIVAFPALDPNTSFQIYCEGNSDNYEEEFEPFQFDVPVE